MTSSIRLLLVAVLLTAACGTAAGAASSTVPSPASGAASSAASSTSADAGVSVATSSGPTLVVLSLDPATPGENAVQVDLRDLVDAPVRGTVRVDLSLDGTSSFSATLAAPGRQGGLRIDHRGHADVRVTVLDGKSAGANAAFTLDLPAERPPDAALADIDRAMASLRSVREAQTLSGGGPLILNHIEYLAPDRVRFITVEPTGEIQETRLIGRDRFDRDPGGGWTRSDLGFPSRVPSTAYARGATRVRIVGHSQDGFEELVEIAFVQGGSYYRVWAGAHDHRVRSYSMMARGHFMTGAYADYDAPIAISVP